jgi:porphobilinogen synthase
MSLEIGSVRFERDLEETAGRAAGERLDRFRRTPSLRRLARESRVTTDDLVQPLFVTEQGPPRSPIASMPGIDRLGLEALPEEIERLAQLGVPAVILFGIPAAKDREASGAWARDGVVQRAVKACQKTAPQMAVIVDVCLCEYTDHG